MTASKLAAPHSSAAGRAPRVPVFPSDVLREAVRRRSVSLSAKTRLVDAIRSVALDIVGDPDSLSDADSAWLRSALATPVNEAAEEALRVLLQELSSTLAAAPARVRPQIVASSMVVRTDFE